MRISRSITHWAYTGTLTRTCLDSQSKYQINHSHTAGYCLLSPFVLKAKKILQDICRENNLKWDDPVPEDFQQIMTEWLEDLPLFESIKLRRCLKPSGFGTSLSNEIHFFADASTLGYGAVAYMRMYNGSMYHSTFLIGKAPLAPMKLTTIPRL